MKSTLISTVFGSIITVLVLLSAGAGLAEGIDFYSLLSLALGLVMFASTVFFWGDMVRHETKMECLQMMIEQLEEVRNLLKPTEQPPKVTTKKK